MEVSTRFDDENGNAARIRAYGSGLEDVFVIDMKRVGRGDDPNFEVSLVEAAKLRSVIDSFLAAHPDGSATAPADGDKP